VYFPQATVVHTYRRMTKGRPLSRTALKHVRAFVYFRWKYRRRWAELRRLELELDLEAKADPSR